MLNKIKASKKCMCTHFLNTEGQGNSIVTFYRNERKCFITICNSHLLYSPIISVLISNLDDHVIYVSVV